MTARAPLLHALLEELVVAVIDVAGSETIAGEETRGQNREQVRRYQRLAGAEKGLVVFATGGVVEVA